MTKTASIIFLLLLSSKSWACQCERHTFTAAEIKKYHYVFTAKLVNVQGKNLLQVNNVLIGNLPAQLEFRTPATDCELRAGELKRDGEYLIASNQIDTEKRKISIPLCGVHILKANASEILNELKK